MRKAADIVKKAKLLSAQIELYRTDVRTKKVFALLQELGLLIFNTDYGRAPDKVSLRDLLWVGERIEPRVIEVLPALLLTFSDRVTHQQVLPEALKNILHLLPTSKAISGSFHGIEFSKMREALQRPLTDRRRRPVAARKIMRSFRLNRVTIERLEQLSKKTGLPQATLIENAFELMNIET